MKNFFEQQDKARRNTVWLLLLFAAAVCLIASSTYVVTILVVKALGLGNTAKQVAEGGFTSDHARMWYPDIFALNFVAIVLLIMAASAVRIRRLKSGGAAVAAMLGARLVNPDSGNPHERRLVNVVEEMAIASGVPTPMIYVLEQEQGINAFAAGYAIDDAAITVTHGLIDNLSRDEMQGVIAHEYSHIFSGDMRLNIQLIGALFGILVMAVVGKGIFQSLGHIRISNGRGGGGIVVLVLMVSILMMIIGYIGLFFGRSIKAAVSRQREYLADAAAVQFTRNPDGLAGALKKIGGASGGSLILAGASEELSHLFFGSAVKPSLFSGLLATHPPLAKRVKLLDPNFDGTFPPWRLLGYKRKATKYYDAAGEIPNAGDQAGDASGAATADDAGLAMSDAASSGDATFTMDSVEAPAVGSEATPAWLMQATGIGDQIGQIQPEQLSYGAALLAGLSPPLRVALHNPFSACALIFCTLLDESIEIREEQYRLIRDHAGKSFLHETVRLEVFLENLDLERALPLVNLALPALREMTATQLCIFEDTVNALIEADSSISVFEFALTRTLLRRLRRAESGRPRRRAADRNKRLPDLNLLLSILARESGADETGIQSAFDASVGKITARAREVMRLLPEEDCSLLLLDETLDRLSLATPKTRGKILDACAHCILADAKVTRSETELLRVFADALDCPLPPLNVPPAS